MSILVGLVVLISFTGCVEKHVDVDYENGSGGIEENIEGAAGNVVTTEANNTDMNTTQSEPTVKIINPTGKQDGRMIKFEASVKNIDVPLAGYWTVTKDGKTVRQFQGINNPAYGNFGNSQGFSPGVYTVKFFVQETSHPQNKYYAENTTFEVV